MRRKTKRFRKKHPEKYAAYVAVQTAVRNGILIAMPCEKCGSTPTHAHHDDYSKPLDVRWLCAVCHVDEHIKVKP
jgi:ribosomal protein S27AE